MDGTKYDGGKIRPSLLPVNALKEVTQVLGFGAQKYDAENWRKLDNATARYTDAMMRHMLDYIDARRSGDDSGKMDNESGLHHLAHAICCGMFIVELENEQIKVRAIPKEERVDEGKSDHWQDAATMFNIKLMSERKAALRMAIADVFKPSADQAKVIEEIRMRQEQYNRHNIVNCNTVYLSECFAKIMFPNDRDYTELKTGESTATILGLNVAYRPEHRVYTEVKFVPNQKMTTGRENANAI